MLQAYHTLAHQLFHWHLWLLMLLTGGFIGTGLSFFFTPWFHWQPYLMAACLGLGWLISGIYLFYTPPQPTAPVSGRWHRLKTKAMRGVFTALAYLHAGLGILFLWLGWRLIASLTA